MHRVFKKLLLLLLITLYAGSINIETYSATCISYIPDDDKTASTNTCDPSC